MFQELQKRCSGTSSGTLPHLSRPPQTLHLGHESAISNNLLREIQVKYPLTRLKSR